MGEGRMCVGNIAQYSGNLWLSSSEGYSGFGFYPRFYLFSLADAR